MFYIVKYTLIPYLVHDTRKWYIVASHRRIGAGTRAGIRGIGHSRKMAYRRSQCSHTALQAYFRTLRYVFAICVEKAIVATSEKPQQTFPLRC